MKRERLSDSDDDTESVAKVSKTEMLPKGQNPCQAHTDGPKTRRWFQSMY